MTPQMMTLRATFFAAIGATMFMLAPASASAAQCRHTVDEDGDPVTMCGSVAYYDDEDDSDDDSSTGSLIVDVEDCEPGKFWMMENFLADEDEWDTPMPCR